MRQIEVSQFSPAEYRAWVSNPEQAVKPQKKLAFEAFQAHVKANEDSNPNLKGGLENIRRIRVLRDVEDVEFKKPVFELQTISSIMPKPPEQVAPPRKTYKKPQELRFPIFLEDARISAISTLRAAAESAKGADNELSQKIEEVAAEIQNGESWTVEDMKSFRLKLVHIIQGIDLQVEEILIVTALRLAFTMIDATQSLLATCVFFGRFDRTNLINFSKRIQGPPKKPHYKGPSIKPPEKKAEAAS